MDVAPIRIVQLSDLHVFSKKNKALLRVKTWESYCAVVDLLKMDPHTPNIILLTGDLSQDNSESSYRAVVDVLKPFSAPIYCVVGNHDNAKVMANTYPYETMSDIKHIVLEHWHLILLNSQKPNATEGFLDRTQINFLQHSLQMYPQHHAIIVLHHHPVLTGNAWLNKIGLVNADEFWQVLSCYPKVHTVLFGHVHQAYEGKKNDIYYYSTPSTCFQFKKNCAKFGLEKVPPGYRWIDLYPNGKLQTGISRTTEYIGIFDSKAKGY